MFGTIVRAAPQALFIAFLSAILARVLGPIMDFIMASESANQDDLLISGLTAASDNFIIVGLIALGVVLLARAILEAQIGGY